MTMNYDLRKIGTWSQRELAGNISYRPLSQMAILSEGIVIFGSEAFVRRIISSDNRRVQRSVMNKMHPKVLVTSQTYGPRSGWLTRYWTMRKNPCSAICSTP